MSRVEVIGNATLYLGDALEVLCDISSIDAVVTDPPYLLGSAATRKGQGFRSRIGEWTNAALWYAEWMRGCWNKLQPSGAMWICGNWRSHPVLAVAADQIGAPIGSIVVWDKQWIGVGSLKGLRQRYELMFLLPKADFAIENRSEPDIWEEKWSSQRPSGHDAEKPVSLMARALSHHRAGVVLDPFMGSGTTGVACAASGHEFVGCEIDERYFDIACRRIEAAQNPNQGSLFGAAA